MKQILNLYFFTVSEAIFILLKSFLFFDFLNEVNSLDHFYILLNMSSVISLLLCFLFFSLFFYFLNLLAWHWPIKLYRFQVYNYLIPNHYSMLNVHHPICFHLHLFPLTPTSFPSGNHHTRLYLWGFLCVWLDPFTYFTLPSNLLPQLSVCSLSISPFLFCVHIYFVH